MPSRDDIVTKPPVTVRRWTGNREHDTARAWSHLSDSDLRNIITTGKPRASVPGARAELKRRTA